MKNKVLLLIAVATLGLTAKTMAQVPSYVPTNGLVDYWPFNGNANDESGNGNNGTVNGATLTADRFGNIDKAYDFDGINDFIQCVNPGPVGQTNFSISFWLNTSMVVNNSPNEGIGHIIGYGAETNGNGIVINVNGSAHNAGCSQGITFDNYGGALVKVDNFNNTWNFYTIVNDISLGSNVNTQKIYKNCILMLQTCWVSPVSPTTNIIGNFPIRIGKYFGSSWVNPYFLEGKLDDIGIWNRALTQQEITDLYNGCQLAVNTQPVSQTININNNAQFIVGSSDTNATYQWQTDLGVGFQNVSNAGQYSGASNDTLSVANVSMSNNNQSFRCIINSGSCADTSNVAVLTINNNVGIHEIAQHNLFSVFPNPAHNVINVKADHTLIGSVFTIYDNTGKAVQSGKINAANTSIELSNLSSGFYMFSVGENRKQSFKIIKE
jgi:hypothetical protein